MEDRQTEDREVREAAARVAKMEKILDTAKKKLADLEKRIASYEAFQSRIRKLEAYYVGPEWKKDFALDEAGRLPADLKRGVLSEDGLYDFFSENEAFLERVRVYG
ncbi:MAG: DUF4298 domain-containing protein [Lachnospiraceae bacterium]|nr:DUF4298 domain-containing protein [Lachnospiraceae bacterium]MBP5254739.1 DUF4298 domain-containing protein [Lachnospiraceae bacterium]